MNNKVNFLRGTSAEYESSIKDNDTFYYTTDTEKLYLGNKEITGGGITVDDTLSDTSKNPVQNKVVNTALNSKANTSDLSEHTDNAEIHVTAAEKAAWDGKLPFVGMVEDLFAVNKTCVCAWNSGTLNTPYKAGLTGAGGGLCIINNASGSTYTSYIVMESGGTSIYSASSNAGVIRGNWIKVGDGGNASTANTASTLATTSSNICLRNLSSGTAEATWDTATSTGNCPVGSWYGKHS